VLFTTPQLNQTGEPIVVTGAGVVTALGLGWSRNLEGFRAGRLGLRPVTLLDVSGRRVKHAVEVDLPDELPATRLEPRQIRRMDRGARMLLLAAEEAWRQSGWEPSEELPLVLGTTGGGMTLGEAYYRQALATPFRCRDQAVRVTHYQSQRQALDLADAFGFTGPVTIISNACASGANAIGHGWSLIRSGRAERVLTGGYDALAQVTFSGFDVLQALSPTCCRPFDVGRDGLALGEGAAVLALETASSARRRGAEILGVVAGYGMATDIHHLTQPHPEGTAALAAMEAACSSAGIGPAEIDYVNAHGTGTVLNDSAEASAINRWAGPRAMTLPVSSTKSSVGHSLGAAGAVEAVVCLMALREGFLPPNTTTETVDPICQFPVVTRPQSAVLRAALSNSFGFGGSNASLVFRNWP
jgi:3-oxoacyl-[acyl-carrier-protein] synthase II